MKKLSLKVKFMCGFVFLGLVLPVLTSCAWWQKHGGQVDCAALATVTDAPQLLAIVEGCLVIAVSPAAIPACIEAASASKWTNDVIQCFTAAAQNKTKCPAYDTAKMASKQASKPTP